MQQPLNFFALLLVVLSFSAGRIWAAAAPSLAKIASYKGTDRQRFLEEGAKKEGKVTLYTSGIIKAGTGRWMEDFQKKYPFVKVDYWRGGGFDVPARVIEEYKANRFVVDIFELNAGQLLTMKVRVIPTPRRSC